MKRTILNLVLIALPFLVFSQQENFIRIVGNSSVVIEPISARVTVQVKDIKRDEYNKIREKSIEEILTELETNLKRLGYSTKDLVEIWPPSRNYNKTKTQKYYLEVKSKEDAKKISKFEIKGFESSNFEYTYDTTAKIDDYKLSKEAMSDAFNKAKALASYANKHIGKVISIEDKSQSKMKVSSHSKTDKITLNYSLIITYELLD